MATAAEILAAIDTAILDILQNGQEVTLNGRRYTKANIKELQTLRKDYSELTVATSAGGVFDRMRTGVPYRA
jgi:hypothetical protein